MGCGLASAFSLVLYLLNLSLLTMFLRQVWRSRISNCSFYALYHEFTNVNPLERNKLGLLITENTARKYYSLFHRTAADKQGSCVLHQCQDRKPRILSTLIPRLIFCP